MRKIALWVSTLSIAVACGAPRPVATTPVNQPPVSVTLPYAVDYSSSWEMTNHKYSAVVMNFWKNWDNNQLDNSAQSLADRITLEYDGGRFTASRDSFITAAKMERGRFKSVESRVSAIFSIRSIDKSDDWVAVWGVEHTEDNNGRRDSIDLQEIWLFDKEGKIVFTSHYRRRFK